MSQLFSCLRLSLQHELEKIQEEALRDPTLESISTSERVPYIVCTVEEEANKVPTQITAGCLATNKP